MTSPFMLFLTDQPESSNYLRKLNAELAKLKALPRGMYDMTTAHDAWCDFLAGRGACNCDPDITIRPRKVAP